MTDELLKYYNRELKFMGQMCADFAAANSDVAPHLHMVDETSRDPHVARLIEAFAYLNARTRRKLEDEFPEITDAMLGVLYPHYLAPIPSMAIVQFQLDQQQGGLTGGYSVKEGTSIEAIPMKDAQFSTCKFRTCYPVELWPIKLAFAQLKGKPFLAPKTRFAGLAMSMLQLQLTCIDPKVTFADLSVNRLRFYLNESAPDVFALYELLLNSKHTLGIAIANSETDNECVILDKDHIRPVGFEADEGMLEYPSASFLGYRLLTEYFAFPTKFMFFDIANLKNEESDLLSRIGNKLCIFVFFDREPPELVSEVSKNTFQLGCCPVVNLFPEPAEPITLTEAESEYHVVSSARHPEAFEIYSIDKVVATSRNGEVKYRPFYSMNHGRTDDESTPFFHPTRRPLGYYRGKPEPGTELYLTIVDPNDSRPQTGDWTIDVMTTSSNRDVPRNLPFNDDQRLRFQIAAGGPLEIRCLTKPTATLRPALKDGTAWRLISHLSLNHLTLVDDSHSLDALRQMLKLYDFKDSLSTRNRINSIVAVSCENSVSRVARDGKVAICRGLRVNVRFDEKVGGDGVYLFASVLERFFSLYSSINSFVALTAFSQQREEDEAIRQWKPRCGDKVLL